MITLKHHSFEVSGTVHTVPEAVVTLDGREFEIPAGLLARIHAERANAAALQRARRMRDSMQLRNALREHVAKYFRTDTATAYRVLAEIPPGFGR